VHPTTNGPANMNTTKQSPDLIIDVGMCDGGDTAYYLHKGYRVLAIEADPVLCETARETFSEAVYGERLQILNAGIAGGSGSLTFYRNLTNLGQSSFDPELGKTGGRYEQIAVDCVTLASVIERHGVPHYLKVDIEGFDEIALSTLRPELAPPYISAELNFTESILERLKALGYLKFKLINQDFHTSSREIAQDDTMWRMLRKMGRLVPPFRSLMTVLPQSWRPRMEWDKLHNPDLWDSKGLKISGPFGEETHGPWLDYAPAKAVLDWAKLRHDYCWWDVHARK